MNGLKQRITLLLQELNKGVFEKEHPIALSLLSAIAGESIFLLGPPGVAKSMVARRLKSAFKDGSAFEYLMSRFSTPDEIFGPVSISKLKDRDIYERLVEGYLPSCTVAFLDEIWKAGPAIHNSLLTILNEKIYRNGRHVIKVPLKGLIAASNELPAPNEGLEALWDRFLVRYLVGGIESMAEFDRMLESTEEPEVYVSPELSIADEDYIYWQKSIQHISLHYSIFEVVHALKEMIEAYNTRLQNENDAAPLLYISDRRWKKAVRLLRTSAFLNEADRVRLTDCLLLTHCLWNEVEQIETVREMVENAIRKSLEGYLLNMRALEQDIEEIRDLQGSAHSLREVNDPGIEVVDNYYYKVEGVRMKERLLIFVADYQKLSKDGSLFCLQKDKYKTNCQILKRFDASLHANIPRSKLYTLQRGSRSVIINGHEYPLLLVPNCPPPPPQKEEKSVEGMIASTQERMGRMEQEWKELAETETAYVDGHLFLNEKEKRVMKRILQHQQTLLREYRNDLNELAHAQRKEDKEYPAERT